MKDVNLQFVSVNMQVKSLDTYEMPTYNLRGNTQEYHVRIEQGTKKNTMSLLDYIIGNY